MAVIYPSEAYPLEAAVQGLDATIDVRTGLAYIAKGVGPNSTPSYEIQYNRRLQRQNNVLAALRAGMVVDEGSTRIGVYPITYRLRGLTKSFDGATAQSVPDGTTRRVYLDAGNTLQIQPTFPSDLTAHFPLATVTANLGLLTIVDERPAVLWEVSPVGTTGATIPFAPSVFLSGTLSVKVYEAGWVAPVDFTLRDATGLVNTAPVGSSLIADVRVDGVSVFAQQADMVVIAAGQTLDTSAKVDALVTAGSVLTFEVEQIGSTTPGADLTIVLSGLCSTDIV